MRLVVHFFNAWMSFCREFIFYGSDFAIFYDRYFQKQWENVEKRLKIY